MDRSLQLIESGEGYFANPPVVFNIVSGQNIYSLPSILGYCPVHVRLVERFYPNQWEVLSKWEKNTGTTYQLGVGSGSWWPSYRFTGTNLVFNQIPNFGQTGGVRIEAYDTPAELEAGQSFDANFPPVHYGLLVLDATCQALDTKEATGMVQDPELFRSRQKAREIRFEETLNNRSDARESVDPFVVDGEDIWD